VAAAAEARIRYEHKVAARKADNEHHIRQHVVNIKQEGVIIEREKEQARQTISEFKHNITK